jgi:hypothetical protein
MAGTNPEKQDKTASIRHTANLTGEEREEYCEGNFGAAAKVSADFCPGMGRSTFKKKKAASNPSIYSFFSTRLSMTGSSRCDSSRPAWPDSSS